MKLVYQNMAIIFNFLPTSNRLHSLQVENCDSNSRLVVDEDSKGLIEESQYATSLTLTYIHIAMWVAAAILRVTIQSPGGGGPIVFVADKLFISTRLGGALKIINFITCLYRTVLEINNLFNAESARNYLFQKNFIYIYLVWHSTYQCIRRRLNFQISFKK